jgi:hypothetical protein
VSFLVPFLGPQHSCVKGICSPYTFTVEFKHYTYLGNCKSQNLIMGVSFNIKGS